MAVRPPRQRLPSLNALRAFETAARQCSFTKAADELGVTPGAVTQQIRQLEAWLGFPVFRRMAQGVEPTEAAQELLPRFTKSFDLLAQATHGLRERHEARAFVIAALPSIAQLWLTPRLPALQQALGVAVSVSAMESQPDRSQRHDLAIFYRPDAPGTMQLRQPDALLPVCSPALAERLARPADLAGATLLHDSVWDRDWSRWLNAAGLDLGGRRGPSFSLYSLALEAALAGSGVLMGRWSLVSRHLEDGRLVAPFDIALPIDERLTFTPAVTEHPHPRGEAICDWLLSAG